MYLVCMLIYDATYSMFSSLEPIAVMLTILLWGSAWVITGARCILING